MIAVSAVSRSSKVKFNKSWTFTFNNRLLTEQNTRTELKRMHAVIGLLGICIPQNYLYVENNFFIQHLCIDQYQLY